MALEFQKQPPQIDVSMMSSEMARRLNEYSRRIKNIEQRMDRMEGRIENLEQNAMNQMNDLKINLERIGQKINATSERLNSIDTEILRLNKDISKTALKSDIKKLETFIDLVNPITSKFVTKDEMERALEERIKRRT